MKIGNLVRITRGQGWCKETDPGIGIVTQIRTHVYLLDELKVRWQNGETLWENSGRIVLKPDTSRLEAEDDDRKYWVHWLGPNRALSYPWCDLQLASDYLINSKD